MKIIEDRVRVAASDDANFLAGQELTPPRSVGTKMTVRSGAEGVS